MVESKATGSDAIAGRWDIKDPTNTKGGLSKPNSGRQLSDDWIEKDLDRQFSSRSISEADYKEVKAALRSNTITRVLVRTSEDNIQFYKVNRIGKKEVVVGEKFIF